MKGYSLHVGVDFVNEEHYGLKLTSEGSSNDAKAMHKLVLQTGQYDEEDSVCLIGQEATSAVFFRKLDQILAKTLINERNGDESYVLINFSGHGAKYKLENDVSEFLCFYDGLVLEYELKNKIHFFGRKTKVFVVIDSCYAHGLKPVNLLDFKAPRSPKTKFLEKSEVIRLFDYKNNNETYTNLIKETPRIEGCHDCKLVYLSACAEDHVTYQASSPDGYSSFTDVLLAKWRDGTFNGSYYDFHSSIIQLITDKKGPKISSSEAKYFKQNTPFLPISSLSHSLMTPNNLEDWGITVNYENSTAICTINHPEYWFKPNHFFEANIGSYQLRNWDSSKYNGKDRIIMLILDINKARIPVKQTDHSISFTALTAGNYHVVAVNYASGEETAVGQGIQITIPKSN
ncbi:MAG: hypothetical protein ACI8ZM_000252 [Crocinitomix sp.]|jgi:hypothetical protein